MHTIYRGYDIEKKGNNFIIRKDGKVVASQPSEEFARKWIDRDKREQANFESMYKK